ncbi:MAG: tetratricopeptide repeat protein [Planctomycetota bacterium]|jgi:tetratricopeptide (TPR) repeat protein
MKADHRHELKTNELAEWLGNLPQWTKENLTTIMSYSKRAVAVEQLEFTNLLNQLSGSKTQILRAQALGRDLSFTLLQPAGNLRTFAQTVNNDRMAALALIKQAEALRTELHYRPGTVSKEDLTAQINQAKAGYADAIERSSFNPSLMAKAKFGLGLCEEELGNFAEAEQIYRNIVANPNFDGTVAAVQAKYRLDTMTDYKQKVVFKPSPKEPTPAALPQPMIQIEPGDAYQIADINLPIDTNQPVDVNLGAQAPNSVSEVP